MFFYQSIVSLNLKVAILTHPTCFLTFFLYTESIRKMRTISVISIRSHVTPCFLGQAKMAANFPSDHLETRADWQLVDLNAICVAELVCWCVCVCVWGGVCVCVCVCLKADEKRERGRWDVVQMWACHAGACIIGRRF